MMSKKGEESNPFYCDDEEGDNLYNERFADDNGLMQTRAKIGRSENQQLESLDRTRRILQETEHIGFQTAEVGAHCSC